jgi:hypothetical protein
MKIYRIINRMRFYVDWYQAMNADQRESYTGVWVLQRIHWYDAAIKDIEASVAVRSLPSGNYLNN